jgi:general secretion pathway protein L
MSSFIISLPLTAASPKGLYAFTEGQAGGSVREAVPSLMPRTSRQAVGVVVVPPGALSWHAVALPAGKALSGQALRALLVGLLEERVLDDVQQLHFALQPEWKPGQTHWVAVCRKDWLQGHLQVLEALATKSFHQMQRPLG